MSGSACRAFAQIADYERGPNDDAAIGPALRGLL